jgi:hypothetical protein
MASVALSPTYLTPDFTPTDLLSGGTAVGAGDTAVFSNNGSSFLVITAEAETTVTVAAGTGATIGGHAVNWPSVSVAAGTKALGPFHSFLSTAGEVSLTFSTAATVTLVQLPGVY